MNKEIKMNLMNNYILYKNKNESIERLVTESNKQFEERTKYIKKLEKHNLIWKEAIRLSIIWYCIKFLKCKYSESLHSKINSYE
jgi:hypothetical protein